VPTLHILRKFRKNSNNQNHRKAVLDFMDKLEENSEFIRQKRERVRSFGSLDA